MTRFMLAAFDDEGMMIRTPLVPVTTCDLCGMLVLEGDFWWKHAHIDDIPDPQEQDM